MLYERKLTKPPHGWGMYLHNEENKDGSNCNVNMFFYQQSDHEYVNDNSDKVYCITYGGELKDA